MQKPPYPPQRVSNKTDTWRTIGGRVFGKGFYWKDRTEMVDMVMRGRWFVILSLSLLILCGCEGNKNLIDNSGFEVWTDMPFGWSVEGDCEVTRVEGGGVLFKAKDDGAPFLYQGVEPRSYHRGNLITLASWVKSSVPRSVVVEFSDRKGTDIKSQPHPGDGRWHLLSVTLRVPHDAEVLEMRLRSYRPGTALFREAAMTVGTGTILKGGRAGVFSLEGVYTEIGIVVLVVLAIVTVRYLDRWQHLWVGRALRTFFILVFMANGMQMLGKEENAIVTSIVAWSVFGILMFVVFINRRESIFEAGMIHGFLKRPWIPFIALSLFGVIFTVIFLSIGSVHLAEKSAGIAYAGMLGGAIATGIKKYLSTDKKRSSEHGDIRLTGTGDEGSSYST